MTSQRLIALILHDIRSLPLALGMRRKSMTSKTIVCLSQAKGALVKYISTNPNNTQYSQLQLPQPQASNSPFQPRPLRLSLASNFRPRVDFAEKRSAWANLFFCGEWGVRGSMALDAQQSLGFIRTTPFIAVLGAITASSSGAVWEGFCRILRGAEQIYFDLASANPAAPSLVCIASTCTC